MPAERKPPSDSLLARPIVAATAFALRVPRFVVIGSLSLALLSILYAVGFLEFKTSRLALLNPNSHYNQRWLAYLEEFGEDDDAVIVVEGSHRQPIVEALNELVVEVSEENELFGQVFHVRDTSRLRRKGLQLLDLERQRQVRDFVRNFQPIIQEDRWNQLQLANLLRAGSQQLSQSHAPQQRLRVLEQMERLASGALMTLADPETYHSPWPNIEMHAGLPGPEKYLVSDDHRFGFVLLKLRGDAQRFDRDSQAVDKLRQLIRHVQTHHDEVQIGLTGMPILENDEMRTSQSDMTRASVLSLLGVAALFMAAFGGYRHPLLTVSALLIALAWSFGYITLAVGHLNILSVSFGVILIGLGIDFGIHYVSCYLKNRSPETKLALLETSRRVGPGIVTGGLTTALAFFTAQLTSFTGIAELGVIAGGGILLCVAAAIFVLPVIIWFVDRHRSDVVPPVLLKLSYIRSPVAHAPRLVLATTMLITMAVGSGVCRLNYDHNLMNLQPVNSESAQLERKLREGTKQSVWYAVSLSADLDELSRRRASFEQLDQVERVEQIASLLPQQQAELLTWLKDLSPRLARLPQAAPALAAPRTDAILAAVRKLREQVQAERPQLDAMPRIERQLRQLEQSLLAGDSQSTIALANYQQSFAGELLERMHQIRYAADPNPIQTGDLPEGLVARFVGKTGQHQLRVFAKANIWDMDNLTSFVQQVERVDPRITGHPIQTYYASRQMQQSYIHAAIYAALAVAIILMLDFRRVRDTLLAMIPVSVGMFQMLGVLGWLNISLNPANMIVLPLILGIGIDDGVHVIHDLRQQKRGYRLGASTAMAIFLTSATTMVGFGSMMLANHRGIRSLGQVLTIGVFCCLLTSLFLLPALLTLISRDEERAETESLPDDTATKTPRRRLRAAG